jgi:hypothetical protein
VVEEKSRRPPVAAWAAKPRTAPNGRAHEEAVHREHERRGRRLGEQPEEQPEQHAEPAGRQRAGEGRATAGDAPVTRSTSRRSAPTMLSVSTGKPWSDRWSTTDWRLA